MPRRWVSPGRVHLTDTPECWGSSNTRSSHTVAHSSSLFLVLCRQSVYLPGMRVVTVLAGIVKELSNRDAAIMIREFLGHDGMIYPGIGGLIGCVGKGLGGRGGGEVKWLVHKACLFSNCNRIKRQKQC